MIKIFQPDLWVTESNDDCICCVTSNDDEVFLHFYPTNNDARPSIIWNCVDIFPNSYCKYTSKQFFSNDLKFETEAPVNGIILEFDDNTTINLIESATKQNNLYTVDLKQNKKITRIKIIFGEYAKNTIPIKILNKEILCEENKIQEQSNIGMCLDVTDFHNYTPQRLVREFVKIGVYKKCCLNLNDYIHYFETYKKGNIRYCTSPITLNHPTKKWLQNIQEEFSKIHIKNFTIMASNNLCVENFMQEFLITKEKKITSFSYHNNDFLEYKYIDELVEIFGKFIFNYNFVFHKYIEGDIYTFYYPVTDADFNEEIGEYDRIWSNEDIYQTKFEERLSNLIEEFFEKLSNKIPTSVTLGTTVSPLNSFFDFKKDTMMEDKKDYSLFNFENNCYNDYKLYIEFSVPVKGDVFLYVEDKVFQSDIINNIATIRLSGLNGGTHTGRVILKKRDKTTVGWNIEFNVVQDNNYVQHIKPLIKVSNRIIVPIIQDIKNLLTLSIIGENYSFSEARLPENDKIIFTPPSLPNGEYNFKLSYTGDSQYNEMVLEKDLTVTHSDIDIEVYSDLFFSKKEASQPPIVRYIDSCLIPKNQIRKNHVSEIFFTIKDFAKDEDIYRISNFLYNCRIVLNKSVEHSHGLFNVSHENWSNYRKLIKLSGNNLNFKFIENFYDFLRFQLKVQNFITPVSYFIYGDNVYFHYEGSDDVIYKTKKNLIVKNEGIVVKNPQTDISAYVLNLNVFGKELLCGNIIENIVVNLKLHDMDEVVLIVDFDGVDEISEHFCESYFRFLLESKCKITTLNMSLDVSNIFASYVYDVISVQEP